MICISTSNNLRECVLRRAGRQTIDSFEANSRPNDALILDGGSTAARKILFVPWETNVDTNETIQNQKVRLLFSLARKQILCLVSCEFS